LSVGALFLSGINKLFESKLTNLLVLCSKVYFPAADKAKVEERGQGGGSSFNNGCMVEIEQREGMGWFRVVGCDCNACVLEQHRMVMLKYKSNEILALGHGHIRVIDGDGNGKSASRLAEVQIEGILAKFLFQHNELDEVNRDFGLVEDQVAGGTSVSSRNWALSCSMTCLLAVRMNLMRADTGT
jgi:hypothetical protein